MSFTEKTNVAFGQKYARYYDALYADKDYDLECRIIRRFLDRYSEFPARRIIDAGCGTANHLMRLGKMGYEMLGIDRSRWMLDCAKRKLRAEGVNATLLEASLEELHLEGRHAFDAAICMFAVLNFMEAPERLVSSLICLQRLLKMGSLFLADMWYGPAVLRVGPSTRIKEANTSEGERVIRIVSPVLVPDQQVCYSQYRFLVMKNGALVDEFEEVQRILFYFPNELRYYLRQAGFEVVLTTAFPEIDKPPSESIWSTFVLAKKVKEL